MSRRTVTRADFARIAGVDRSAVTRWVQRGLPSFDNGEIDPVTGMDWVRECVDSYKIRGSLGARQAAGAEVGRWQRALITTYTSADEAAAYAVAELLLPLLPEATCRAVVAKLLSKLRAGSVECLGEEIAPPAGCRTWADDARFKGELPTEFEWTELLQQLAAGRLEVVGG